MLWEEVSLRVVLRCLLKCVREMPCAAEQRVGGGERHEVWNDAELKDRSVVVAEAIAIVVLFSLSGVVRGERKRVSLEEFHKRSIK